MASCKVPTAREGRSGCAPTCRRLLRLLPAPCRAAPGNHIASASCAFRLFNLCSGRGHAALVVRSMHRHVASLVATSACRPCLFPPDHCQGSCEHAAHHHQAGSQQGNLPVALKPDDRAAGWVGGSAGRRRGGEGARTKGGLRACTRLQRRSRQLAGQPALGPPRSLTQQACPPPPPPSPSAMTRVAGALGKSGEVMKLVNNLMRVPALQKTMVEMSRGGRRRRGQHRTGEAGRDMSGIRSRLPPPSPVRPARARSAPNACQSGERRNG